jgi:hypothetical protein
MLVYAISCNKDLQQRSNDMPAWALQGPQLLLFSILHLGRALAGHATHSLVMRPSAVFVKVCCVGKVYGAYAGDQELVHQEASPSSRAQRAEREQRHKPRDKLLAAAALPLGPAKVGCNSGCLPGNTSGSCLTVTLYYMHQLCLLIKGQPFFKS